MNIVFPHLFDSVVEPQGGHNRKVDILKNNDKQI